MCLLALILKSDIDTLIICIYTAQGKLVIFTKVTIMDNPPPHNAHNLYLGGVIGGHFKPEAHGPHRSPETQFKSLNTFAHDTIIP